MGRLSLFIFPQQKAQLLDYRTIGVELAYSQAIDRRTTGIPAGRSILFQTELMSSKLNFVGIVTKQVKCRFVSSITLATASESSGVC